MSQSPTIPPSQSQSTLRRHSATQHLSDAYYEYEAERATAARATDHGASQHTQWPQTIDRRTSSLVASFGHAFEGIWHLFATQRNAQIHLLISGCALALAAVLGVARWEWLILVLTIALVLAAEGVNTAVEAAVNVATENYHPQARIAKDVAAGAVVLCALASVAIGCLIFLPHLWPIITHLFARLGS
jgi:diacylglycerol kinase (ATP)